MSWLFSQALVEAFSEANSLDGAPFAPSSGTPMPPAFLWRGKTTDAWPRFPSSMTCSILTDAHGEALLTWFREGFPAKTYPLPARGGASTESVAACGEKWPESLAKWDPATSSWKTHQCLLFEDSTESLETLPRWGLMRGGELWPLPTPEHLIDESESGSWPTPQMVDYKGTSESSKFQQRQAQFATWTNGEQVSGTIYPHPDFYDGLMGWPTEWSASSALVTAKFRKWCASHGIS